MVMNPSSFHTSPFLAFDFQIEESFLVVLGQQRKLSTEELVLLNVVLEKTLESLLDCKKIQPVHPKGDQSWVFIGRTDVEAETPILWPPDVKS